MWSRKSIVRDRAQKDNSKQEFGTFFILSWNSWISMEKGPMFSFIFKKIDITFLVENWEHGKYKVPNIELFFLHLVWSKAYLVT